jgi:Tfp pilus assembly protein PilF
MSRAYDRAQGNGAEDAPLRKAQAYAATDRALALDPTLAEAHVARARLQWIDHLDAAAEESFRHAIALNPNYATAHHWHGIQLFIAGRFDQGLAELAVAMQLDPLSSVAFGNHAGFLRDVRRWPEALASAQRTIELFPEYRATRIFKVDALIGLGRYAEARELWQADAGAAWTESLEWKTREVIWLAQSGDRITAARMAAPILAEPANARHGREMLLIHVALGRLDEAFAYVERNNPRFTTSRFFLVTWLDPVFDSVRDDPRFLRILENAGMLDEHRELWARYLAWTKKIAAP